MAFTEDLSQFFSEDDFAVSATFNLKAGGTRNASVIFNSPTQGVQIFDTEIEADAPFLTCQTVDLIGVSKSVTTGGKTYAIKKIVDEGTGTSSVYLS
jgi:hypothetical protein